MLTHCFGLNISARLLISERYEIKLLMTQIRFVQKYFSIHKQAVGKFALNVRLT